MQSPPSLIGSSRPVSSTEPSSAVARLIPHCNEQYGQCVAVAAAVTPTRLSENDYTAVVGGLHPGYCGSRTIGHSGGPPAGAISAIARKPCRS